jgi:hypothetical protein
MKRARQSAPPAFAVTNHAAKKPCCWIASSQSLAGHITDLVPDPRPANPRPRGPHRPLIAILGLTPDLPQRLGHPTAQVYLAEQYIGRDKCTARR